jgi:two-component system chemotaxis response regulator CheY
MNAPRIALIDDDRSWLEVLSEYLERKGFRVYTAASAAEGLNLLRENGIFLVICDYDMPGMDGLEFMRTLRHERANVAILMVSNQDEPGFAHRAMAEGARGFLPKTVSATQLLRRLRQILADLDTDRLRTSTLHLWQRLLPSPQNLKRGRGKDHQRVARAESTV